MTMMEKIGMMKMIDIMGKNMGEAMKTKNGIMIMIKKMII